MPRGRKKIIPPVAERIEAVKTEIEELSARLKDKKAELKALETEQAEGNKAKLLEAVEASGKSVDEIVAWLEGGLQ